MTVFLRQSTAIDVALGPFLDATDGVTAETGLTISQADVRLKKNDGAWAQVNDNTAATHEENGWYEKELNTTDTNTVGRLLIAVHESGALPVWHEFWVLEEAVYDAFFAASAVGYIANAPVNVAQFGGSNGTFASGRPEVNTTLIEGSDATNQIRDAVVDDSTRIDASALNTLSSHDPGETIMGATDLGNGSGLTEAGGTGDHLTAVPWNASWDAEVQSEVQDAIEANHLDHLLAQTYDPSSKPGAADALLNELVENDGGVARFTANALEEAPAGGGGGGPTAEEIADAVWTEAIADHSGESGSTAEALNAAGAAGDPWSTQLPGAYGAGSAGLLLGTTIPDAIDTIDGVVDDILTDTAVIGAAGAGLTEAGGTGDHLSAVPWNSAWDAEVESEVDDALGSGNGSALTSIPWNAAWDAEVQSEAADALNAYDPPTKAELDSAVSPLATSSALATVDSNVDSILADTNELQGDWANGGRLDLLIDAILADTAELQGDWANGGRLDLLIDAIKAKTDQLTFTVSNQVDANALTVDEDEVWDDVIEGSLTARQLMRLFASVLLGKLAGAATTTNTFRDTGDSKNRVTATVDSDGNRTAVTLDAT